MQVWDAIEQGNPQWQIPAYNGGLFSADQQRSRDGALIAGINLPDIVLGPALRSLLIDVSDDGIVGPVDFRSLSVREFGTIYEGLLESSLSLAEQDLTVDANGTWVAARADQEVVAPAGSVYFHTASGERKATGSYFTPKVVVDHLIERSIVPTLTSHLNKIAAYLTSGDSSAAAREFFDYRVADLAMGSGHFLVAAVDKIEALMRDFLTAHHVPGVTEELLRLAGLAKEALGSDDVAKSEVEEIGLLRRQVARRCIYGVDANPMAVELARLALWIHTFVPGLPMSNLDHGLVHANSLTGIGTIEEALDALQPGHRPGQTTIFDEIISSQLESARTLLVDLANASEASKAEVEQGTRILREAHDSAATARQIFDSAVAVRLGRVNAGDITDEGSLLQVINQPNVAETASELNPAHMPYLFPEVFLRSNPGFDALIGNPPWEKLKVQTDQWWGLRLPGLRGMPQQQRRATLKAFRESRPDLEAAFEAEKAHVVGLNEAIKASPFELGSGDTDLYQAFAWRNWQLIRSHGRCALVLPRGAHSGSPLTQWRRAVLAEGAFSDVCFLVNNQQWLFPQIHPQYTVGLTVISRGSAHLVRWSGPFSDETTFLQGAGTLMEVGAPEFDAWSDTAAFPLLADPVSVAVFRQMQSAPRFDSVRHGWEFRLTNELHSTNDRDLYDFDLTNSDGRTPVLAGASFNLWNPDADLPYAYSITSDLRSHLRDKLRTQLRQRRSAYFGMTFPGDALPLDRPRIVFRKISRPTDTRTAIACLIPPGTSVTEAGQLVVTVQGGPSEEAFLLGVLSSIPFDWGARRWVELNFNFYLMNPLRVPLYDISSPLAARVAEIAGRLAAVDHRYSDWAAQVGVPVNSVRSPSEKSEMLAELDALAALLYGLHDDQVEHIFATFHRGWTYQPRLGAALAHYRRWKAHS